MQLKTFLFFLAILLSTNAVFGQAKVVNSEPEVVLRNTILKQSPSIIGEPRSIATDTLVPTIFADDDCSLDLFSFLNNQGWGFVGGMNSFMDLEKAQRFNYVVGNYQLNDVFLFLATVDLIGDGNVFAKIYEVDPVSNGPGTLVGTSNPVKVSELNVDETDVVPTLFTFETPPIIEGPDFFVSLDFAELYETQDTISLLMSDLGCGIEGDTWELFSDGETWVSMSDSLSWGITSNIFMIASVTSDAIISTKELLIGKQRIRLYDAFPNPTDKALTIAYDLTTKAEVQIEIYGLDGQLIKQLAKKTQLAGEYQEKIDIDDLPSGAYFYGITTNMGRLMNKFSVVR